MTRNWPKLKRNRTQAAISELILRLLKNLPHTPITFLQNIKESSSVAFLNSERTTLQAPELLKVDIAWVGFSDIFFAEDFQQLQKGLNKLFEEYPTYIKTNTMEHLNDWFKEISKVENQVWKHTNVGMLTFKKHNMSDYFSGIHLGMHYCHPSVIILTVRGNISDTLKERFAKLTRSNPSPELRITKFNLFNAFIGWNRTPGNITRKREIDGFFMEINQSVVQVFRENLRSGLSRFGPIPMIEILETNLDFREAPLKEDEYKYKAPAKIRHGLFFLESIGYPSTSYRTIYTREPWWFLHAIDRTDSHYSNHINYQIFVSNSMFQNEQKQDSTISATRKIVYDIDSALFLMALQHFYTHLNTKATSTRRILESSFNGKRKRLNPRSMSHLMFAMLELNDLDFKHKIVQRMISEHCILERILGELPVYRNIDKDSSKVSLVSDVKQYLKRENDSYEQQREVLKIFYETLISYRTTVGNYALQRSTFILSVAVLFLTILTLLPEAQRSQASNSIMDFLGEIRMLLVNQVNL
jgi:hypothetical protein